MSVQSTVHTDWKCSKNGSYAKTICRTSSQAESFAMLHFSHCEKENLVILMMRVRQYVRFTYEETVNIPVYSVTEESGTKHANIICAVDLGINTDAACSIMRPDGTVIGRKFINAPVEKDRMYRILGQIKRSQSRNGNYSHRKLWRFVNYYNEQISIHTASEIVAFAASFNAKVIVLEHLDINGKKRGSKKQRLHLWRKKDVLKRVTELAHKKKMLSLIHI